MSYSSGSLFFTGIVAILIIFQVTTTINFYISNTRTTEIIENQKIIIDHLEEKEEPLDRYGNPVSEERNYSNCLKFDDYPDCPQELLDLKEKSEIKFKINYFDSYHSIITVCNSLGDCDNYCGEGKFFNNNTHTCDWDLK